LSFSLTKKRFAVKSIIFLAIPLVLSAYTHLWNIAGFPAIHPDEGVYMKRAMLVMNGTGPHDYAAIFDHPGNAESSYDHPYFGQIFLAAVLGMIGYPNSLNPSADGNVHSIEMLYLVPRVLMGLLAVLDTFLVYKIAERRYSRNVALIASVVFAVMPLSWLYRWVLLDSILLPFLLSSILLAIYTKSTKVDTKDNHNSKGINRNIIVLLSGILLGLSIYTKIPAFTMIPLIGLLIYQNNNKSLKTLGLWFIPVILIPLMWPAYSISVGQFDEWMRGVLWQGVERNEGTGFLPDIKLTQVLKSDPVLFILGSAGFIFSIIKRDFFPLMWIIPYLVLLAIVGWVILFHWIPVLPAFCIAIGRLIEGVSQKIFRKTSKQKSLIFSSIVILGVFGLVITSLLIFTNFSSSEFEAAAFVTKYLQESNHSGSKPNKDNNNIKDGVTVVTSPIFSWILKYVFKNDHISSHIRDSQPLQTDKVLLIADGIYKTFILKETQEDEKQFGRIRIIYDNTRTISKFDKSNDYYNLVKNIYPYDNIIRHAWSNEIDVRAN
jgi:hypothetical protein